MLICNYTDTEKHSQCKNKQCIFTNWEEKKEQYKIKKALQETEELLQKTKQGEQFYGVTKKGLLHKRNILIEEMMKYEN